MKRMQNPNRVGRPVISRTMANRILSVVALLAIVLGLALGHGFITWLNATLL